MIDSTGLKKRKTYDEIVNIIQDGKDKIHYPNRKASFLMRTNQFLSLLDLDGLDEQENHIAKQKIAETIPISIGLGSVRSAHSGSSSSSSGSYKSVPSYYGSDYGNESHHPDASSSHMPRRPDIFRMDQDSEIQSEADDLDDHIDEQQSTISAKSAASAELGREHLEEAARQTTRPFLHRIYEKKSLEAQLKREQDIFHRRTGASQKKIASDALKAQGIK